MSDLSALAAALKHSFDTGDRSRWEALMAPTCVNWHNTDRQVIDSHGNPGAAALRAMVPDLRADIVKDIAFPGGHLLCMVVRGTVASTGRELDAHNCVVVELGDEGMTRIDDYVDPAMTAAFLPLPATD